MTDELNDGYDSYTIECEKIDKTRYNQDFMYSFGPASLQFSEEFYNNLPFPIMVTTRDGFRYIIKPENDDKREDRLFIYSSICVPQRPKVSIIPPDYIDSNVSWAKDRNNRIEIFRNNEDNCSQRVQRTTYTFRYSLSIGDINSVSDLYLENLDVLISVYRMDKPLPIHPFSTEGISKRSQIMSKIAEHDFGIYVKANAESEDTCRTIYTNINGNVYKIPVNYDPNITPGIKVIYKNRITKNGVRSKNEIPTEHYTWDRIDNCPFKFYNTYEEAKSYGNDKANFEKEVVELKKELMIKRNQLDIEKTERDTEYNKEIGKYKEKEHELKVSKLNAETELAKAKQELESVKAEKAAEDIKRDKEITELKHQLDLERLKQEKANTTRKGLSDLFKWAPLVVSTITSAIGIFLSVSKSALSLALLL